MRISDWSSDVCSSDLEGRELRHQGEAEGSVDVLRQHAEHKDQQDADEEGRQRDADEGESEEDLGQEAAPLQARVDAQRHADEEGKRRGHQRPEEHTSELQSLMRISYAVFCLNKHTIMHNNQPI